MDKQYQVVALIGKAGAGKDFIQKTTCQANPHIFNSIVSCTTRPQRDNEQEGVDYFYLSLEDFTRKILNGDMFEATEFNGWFYGTAFSALSPDKINIGVFNPAGVSALLEAPNIAAMVIYVDAPDKVRLMRYLQRSENPNCAEMCRRYFADEQDFSDIDFDHHWMSNKDGDCTDLMQYHEFNVPLGRMWLSLGNDPQIFCDAKEMIKAK